MYIAHPNLESNENLLGQAVGLPLPGFSVSPRAPPLGAQLSAQLLQQLLASQALSGSKGRFSSERGRIWRRIWLRGL